MAGVYIEGIKMPVGEELLCLNIFPDGKVTNHFKLRCDGIARAFPVPDHERLIEAERLKEVFHRNVVSGDAFDQLIDIAPTIIPADKEGET